MAKSSRSKSRSRRSKSRSRSNSLTIRKPRIPMGIANPVTGEDWSLKYRRNTELRRKVSELPASSPIVKKELFNLLDQTNIILLSGETGSGKTTQVPKLLWEYLNYADTVICTQPRTLTTSYVAERVSQEMDLELGRQIGFRFRGSEEYKGGDIMGYGILVYMTEGTFLNDTIKEPAHMAYYGGIIIDEAHDRNIDTDFLMFYIREVLRSTAGITTKFIIMSATLDKDIFMDYFKEFNIQHYHIPGRTFPVESKFLNESIYAGLTKPFKIFGKMEETVTIIVHNLMKKRPKKITEAEDILVFMPSIAKIFAYKNKLNEYLLQEGFTNFQVMDLSSATPQDERYSRAQIIPGTTKIVLSTPIAETGVTINGVTYVIDSGLAYDSDFNHVTRNQILDLNFISQAEVKQRRGRAGRVKPGLCYHLYTKEEYQSFRQFKLPQIMRANYDKWTLGLFNQFKNQDNSFKLVTEVFDLLITPPEAKGLASTFKHFRQLKLIGRDPDGEANRLTELGECFNAMDLNLTLAYAFFAGLNYGVELEIMADLIAMIEVKPNLGGWLSVPRGEEMEKEFRDRYENKYGDLMALYHIYLDWKTEKIPETYLRYLNLSSFERVADMSQMLTNNPTVSVGAICENLIKPKYRVSQRDIYMNVTRALSQAMPENIIRTKILDLEKFGNRYQNNFVDLGKYKEVLALSIMEQKVFGGSSKIMYDNFLNLI